MIFVFGSNLAGIHGAGAARDAMKKHGALFGVGVGLTGQAYAIPTKDAHLTSLPLYTIQRYVDDFILFANKHPDVEFKVTRIGCGLAGYKNQEIAPMFKEAPGNCLLPVEWQELLGRHRKYWTWP